MKRFKMLACKVLTREIGYLSAQCENMLDITWLRQGYHNEPDVLRKILQENIDRIDAGDDPYTCSEQVGDFDAILLGYGLCSNGICGVSSKKYPIVVPKAHDCITLFLGSKERYKTEFDKLSGGIYWYTPGWIENSLMPSPERYKLLYDHYAEEYGEENAEYLVEMESGWLREYRAAAYVELDNIVYPDYRAYSKACADYLSWKFLDYVGDSSLLKNFLDGNWSEDDFLIIPPGHTAEQSYDENIIKCVEK